MSPGAVVGWDLPPPARRRLLGSHRPRVPAHPGIVVTRNAVVRWDRISGTTKGGSFCRRRGVGLAYPLVPSFQWDGTNGCSIPFTAPGSYDNFLSLGYDFSFRNACDAHDMCYYTLGSSPEACNVDYINNLNDICYNGQFQGLTVSDILSGGTARAAAVANCYTRAGTMHSVVVGAQYKYHADAQRIQGDYINAVSAYLGSIRNTTVRICTTNSNDVGAAVAYWDAGNGSWTTLGSRLV